MTGLAQIALAFCRECLGWRKAEPSGVPFVELMWENAPGGTRFLRFADLNAVMAAVRRWCDEHDHWVELHSYWDEGWIAEVGPSAEDDGEDAISTDPCHALLAATVEAARKLIS